MGTFTKLPTGRSTIAYRARWILPITGSPILGGYLTVRDRRIRGLGKSTDAIRIVDLGDVTVLPGLVNAHTHLEFSDLKQPLGAGTSTFSDWIRAVLAYRQDNEDAGRDAHRQIERGLVETWRGGAVAVGEISTRPRERTTQFTAAPSGTSSSGTSFLELLGLSDERVARQLETAREYVRQPRLPMDQWTAGLSPHAPYTTRREIVEETVALAGQANITVAMHLAETREEIEILANQTGPLRSLLEERGVWNPSAFPRDGRPMAFLERLADAPSCLVVHGNYLQPDEIEFVAAHRNMTIVYCPRTHSYFRHERYPIAEMLQAGVQVAIGTDSRASNPDVSPWNELRFAVAKHAEIAPESWLSMATVNGLQALRIDSNIYELAENWLVATVPVVGRNDPYACLTESASEVGLFHQVAASRTDNQLGD